MKEINEIIGMFSDIKLKKKDIDRLFDKFKIILEMPELSDIIKRSFSKSEIKKGDRLWEIMVKISKILSLGEINKVSDVIIKERGENLLEFTQDIIIKKLI